MIEKAGKLLYPVTVKQQLVEALEAVMLRRRHEYVPSAVYYISTEVLNKVETALRAAKEAKDG